MRSQHSFSSRLLRDITIAAAIAAAAFAIGVGSNFVRSKPLPWVYTPPAQALAVEKNAPNPPAQHSAVSSETGSSASPASLSELRIVSLEETRKMVDSGGALILDARPDLFHQLGHIKGAKNLSKKNFKEDFETLKGTLEAALKKSQPIILYCADVHCPDASTVAGWLIERGFGSLLIFEGGWAEWEAAGLGAES